MIYFDYCSTTPISDQALQVYTKVSKDFFGNSSSLHDIGTNAKHIVELSREAIATCLHGKKKGLYFTSGGSEANYLAIRSLIKGKSGKHLITTQVEHSSVLQTFEQLEQEGYHVTRLPVNHYGEVSIKDVINSLTDETVLVSIGHANSDIGTVQNIDEIGTLLRKTGVLFHSDCVQTFGKIPIDLHSLHVDSISISSHKIYGPKGIGACYINPSVFWKPVYPNTSHENGFRPGTLNVPAIAAFAEAAINIIQMQIEEEKRLKTLRDRLLHSLTEQFAQIELEGHPTNRLPNHLALRVKGMEGQYLMLELNKWQMAVSTGSACQVGKKQPSRTMLAIGRTISEANELVRISLGRFTKEEHIDRMVEALQSIITNYFTKEVS